MNLRFFVRSAFVALASAAPLVAAVAHQPGPDHVSAAPAVDLDSAFHEAVLKCFRSYRYDDSAMRELLRQGADINAVDAEGNNALMLLIKAADGHSEYRIEKELFEFLRDAGIDLHARNKAGLNAAELNYCLYCPYEFLKKEFEQAGVPVSPGAQLSAAAAGSNVAEVERLLLTGADPNFNRACALLQCIGIITDGPQKNEVIIAALLLQAGADPNLGGDSLMTRAVLSDNSEELVPLLLQHGFRVRDFDAETTGRWMEHLLVHRSPARVETVNLLICHGAVLNDENWYTPFFCHLVTDGNGNYQDMQIARHFIELGLDATRQNNAGQTALMIANEKNLGRGIRQILANPEAVLAERQQKAQVVDEVGRTQLMLAVADPHQPAIEVYKCLRAGVDVHARDAQGRTALFYINSFCPQKDLKAKLLIEAGADVNARDAQGLTPLLALPYVHDLPIPQQRSCAPIIRLLAESGADLNACDKDGYTRIELMLRRGNLSLMDWESVMLLQKLGCSPRPERLNN